MHIKKLRTMTINCDVFGLNRLYLDESLTFQERWTVTLMVYGSQSNELDYHMVSMQRYYLQL